MSASDSVPDVPIHLAGFPTVGGLVVPFVALRHNNGQAALGILNYSLICKCLRERLCGVCGHPLPRLMVFLMRPIDLARGCSSEPGMCPPCAAYTQRACPMLNGQMDHYRKSYPAFARRECDDPTCLCWAWFSQPSPARYGAPAEDWHALWTRGYRLITTETGHLAAGFAGTRVLKLRSIQRPPAGTSPPRPAAERDGNGPGSADERRPDCQAPSTAERAGN